MYFIYTIMIFFEIVFLLIIVITIILTIYYNKQIKYSHMISNQSIIPLNIYQTWYTKNLPPKMKECVESIKYNNPEFNHYLFNDEECREFLKLNFNIDVLYAYDTMIPGAYKADLWRYCILYKQGGIYLDIKYKCVNGFKFISLTNEKEYFVRDLYDSNSNMAIYNAFMICQAGNEIMLKCINEVVKNVRNRFYGLSSLHVTGPSMMIDFFTPYQKQKTNYLYHHSEEGKYYIVHKDKIILMVYPEYRYEQRKNEKNKHYSILWKNKAIYVN